MQLFREIKNIFEAMEKQFNKEHIGEFVMSNHCELCNYHFGLGTWIRNYLIKEQSELLDAFESMGITELDDISELLIELYYFHAKNVYNSCSLILSGVQ